MSIDPVGNIRELLADASLLFSKEVELAKAEAGEKMEQAQLGFISVLSGLLIAFVALMVLVQALVVALANVMPPSLASLTVGALLTVIAYLAFSKGLEELKPKNLSPRRTLHSIRRDARTLAGE